MSGKLEGGGPWSLRINAPIPLFGSLARGDAAGMSDVDLAIRPSVGFSSGGFDHFDRLEALRERLAELLGCEVDLVEEPVVRPRLREVIAREGVRAFQPPRCPVFGHPGQHSTDPVLPPGDGPLDGDSRTRDAVERCLERLSEAAVKLGRQADELAPGPSRHAVRAFGNVLRHAYDQVDPARIWEIATRDLPQIATAAELALQRLGALPN